MAKGQQQQRQQPAGKAEPDKGAVVVQQQNAFLGQLEEYAPNFLDALPPEIPVAQFKRVIVTAVSQNPDLLYANRRTLFTACMKAAVDGLLPDGREGALVVYNTEVKQRDDQGVDRRIRLDAVQWMPMVQGIRKKMRNTGEVLSARAEAVYANDKFRYRLGDDEFIEHEPPLLGDDRGEVIGAYAIIRLTNGDVIRDVLNKRDIEAARNVSKAKNGPMWTNFYGEAARKTAMRRCSKQAPLSASLHRVLNRDDELDEIQPDHQLEGPAEPEPQRQHRAPTPEPEDTRPQFPVVDEDGVESLYTSAFRARDALVLSLTAAAQAGLKSLEGMWESNQVLLDMLNANGRGEAAGELAAEYARLHGALKAKETPPAEPTKETPAAAPAQETSGRSGPSSATAEGSTAHPPGDRGPSNDRAHNPGQREGEGSPPDAGDRRPENPLQDGRQGGEGPPPPEADDGWPGPKTTTGVKPVCPQGGICQFTAEQCANGLSCQRGAQGARAPGSRFAELHRARQAER